MICYIYSPYPITLMGVVDKISNFYFESVYADAGQFGFWCPLEYKEFLAEENIVWTGETKAGIIESVTVEKSETGQKQLKITGHTAEIYLERRTIYPMFSASGYAGNIICSLVSDNLVQPDDQNRSIDSISLQFPSSDLGGHISYQQTGGNLLDEVSALCKANSLDFHLKFNPDSRMFVFEVFAIQNRSESQQVNSPVIISSDLDDLLSANYFASTDGWKNYAYVAGEGEGASRKYATTQTIPGVSSYQRRELFVDARDLQSDTGEAIIPADEYNNMLIQRGNEKLIKRQRIQEFEALVRNNPQSYVYGVDYFLGDTVTVRDSDLGVVVDAIVCKATTYRSQGKEETEIAFGFGVPTISDRMKGAGI